MHQLTLASDGFVLLVQVDFLWTNQGKVVVGILSSIRMYSGSSRDLFSWCIKVEMKNHRKFIFCCMANWKCSLLISSLISLTSLTNFIGCENSAKCTLFWLEAHIVKSKCKWKELFFMKSIGCISCLSVTMVNEWCQKLNIYVFLS